MALPIPYEKRLYELFSRDSNGNLALNVKLSSPGSTANLPIPYEQRLYEIFADIGENQTALNAVITNFPPGLGVVSLNGLSGLLTLTGSSDVTVTSGGTNIALGLSNTGVVAGTFGDATHVPQFTVNSRGRLTLASNVAINGAALGAITVNAGSSTGLTVTGSPVSLGGTLTVGSITDALRYGSLGLGLAAGSAGTLLASTLIRGPLSDKGGIVFDVLAYGALFDGTGDDSVGVQAAITAAQAQQIGGIGVIQLPRTGSNTFGRFLSAVVIPSGITVHGHTMFGTTIKTVGDGISAFVSTDTTRVIIENVGIVGTGGTSTVPAIVFTNSSYPFMKNVTVESFAVGVSLRPGSISSFGGLLRDCRFVNNPIGIDLQTESNQTVLDNVSVGATSIGLKAANLNALTILGGNYEGGPFGITCIDLDGVTSALLAGVRFENTGAVAGDIRIGATTMSRGIAITGVLWDASGANVSLSPVNAINVDGLTVTGGRMNGSNYLTLDVVEGAGATNVVITGVSPLLNRMSTRVGLDWLLRDMSQAVNSRIWDIALNSSTGNFTILALNDNLTVASVPLQLSRAGIVSVLSGMKLLGSTSGSVSLAVPAVAGTNTLTWPAGTTNFSATGGTSQVVKQVSAGAAFTVGQLAASDLTNGTTGSAAVVLATSPTITTPTISGVATSTVATGTAPFAIASTTRVSNLNVAAAALADTATALATARTINGTSFDGTANITITAVPSGSAGGDLTGTYPNPTIASTTGSGAFARATSPTFVTPVLGAATATSLQAVIGNVTPAAGTFTALVGTSGTLAGLTSFGLRDTGGTFDLLLAATGSGTSATRTLTLNVSNASRTLTLTGNPTLSDWFDQAVKAASLPQFAGLGVGVAASTYKVDISGSSFLSLALRASSTGSPTIDWFNATSGALGEMFYADDGTLNIYANRNATLVVSMKTGIVVGSPTGGDKGAGSINAVTVWRNGTALDTVFEPGYALLSIPAMRKYIAEHRHLPTIPTNKVHESGSTNVGALSDKLWETAETHALYIADLDTEIAQLKEQVALLTKRLAKQ